MSVGRSRQGPPEPQRQEPVAAGAHRANAAIKRTATAGPMTIEAVGNTPHETRPLSRRITEHARYPMTRATAAGAGCRCVNQASPELPSPQGLPHAAVSGEDGVSVRKYCVNLPVHYKSCATLKFVT